MKPTRLFLHSAFAIGRVDPRIFGGFLEHLGRAAYGGVFEPGNPQANADGFRTDVMEALRRLSLTVVRYPGRNFASGYHWVDGVGPRRKRLVARELAWKSIEPNTSGTDEFVALCGAMDWAPMLTVNLGTGSPEEARNWVEYCNAPLGTRYADLRAQGGHREPYGVKLWCLGNEMDGDWQLGHAPAGEYSVRARQAAKMMKDCDPSIETVVCGSCGVGMPTYMEWDRQVLEYFGDCADCVSLHRYVGNQAGDTPDFLAVTASVDRQIEEMDAACRFAQARRKAARRPYLCFDERNVWYRAQNGDGKWTRAPRLIQEVYNVEDALVVAGFLNSFIRHADIVRIANIPQIVNVIAPVVVEGDRVLAQSIFHPFAMFSRRRDGTSLRVAIDGPSYEGKTNGRVSYLDASAVLGPGLLHVFLVNRHEDEAGSVAIEPTGLPLGKVSSAEVLTGPGPKAANSWEKPGLIAPRPLGGIVCREGKASVELPPLSVAALSFKLG